MGKREELEKLFGGDRESNRNLLKCATVPACEGKKTFVHDLNPPNDRDRKTGSSFMIVGEAPGFQENKKGIPFVGQSGYIIDKELKKVDISREDVYITNAVKCYPTKEDKSKRTGMTTRAPTDEEIADCAGLLKEEIDILKPKVILAMGRTAIKSLTGINSITTAIKREEIEALETTIIPTYHPAAALHGSEANLFAIRAERENAFKKVKEILKRKTVIKKTLIDFMT